MVPFSTSGNLGVKHPQAGIRFSSRKPEPLPRRRKKVPETGHHPEPPPARLISGCGEAAVGRWVLADSHSSPILPHCSWHVPSPLRPQFPHLHNKGDDASLAGFPRGWHDGRCVSRLSHRPSSTFLSLSIYLFILLSEMETVKADVESPTSSTL